ncbi:hypothetical protein EYF80_057203 [Liparis tanakae]|uniref:Uncharacterized protein n=1 Tax=Liparis tanakae TaxID=230148 RepID=A0A4Z2EW91_9TELE|nr:hypothetical protein EYF80_057203 [Liparis tanakae]
MLSITQDWTGRMAARQGGFRRAERKPPAAPTPADSGKVWKRKLPQAGPQVGPGPPPGPGPHGRPGPHRGGSSTAAPRYKESRSGKRLPLLASIGRTQPSAMMWGKSWKYNKSSSPPAGGAAAAATWGQCWMFAPQQPRSEPGTPWLNGPDAAEPQRLHLCGPASRPPASRAPDRRPAAEDWQRSWRSSQHQKQEEDASCVDGGRVGGPGSFGSLLEEAWSSPEWSDAWRCTRRPGGPEDPEDPEGEASSTWSGSWKLGNHHGGTAPRAGSSAPSGWAGSWRSALSAPNNHAGAGPPEDHRRQGAFPLQAALLVCREQRLRELYAQLGAPAEWTASWQVAKNNSTPCEELQKVLKLSAPQREAASDGRSHKERPPESAESPTRREIYGPKRPGPPPQLDPRSPPETLGSEWKDAWKTLKHRRRAERRRMRPEPSRPFGARGDGPDPSDWTGSWRSGCRSAGQEAEAWQQGWASAPPPRVDRARDRDHFAPVELPKNGPTGERSWAESWRFLRRPGPGQQRLQPGQERSGTGPHLPGGPGAQRRPSGAASDWQAAWTLSETPFHHDTPSLSQWRAAWRSSPHTDLRADPADEGTELRPQRDLSRALRDPVLGDRPPEDRWRGSWRAGSLLSPTGGSSGGPGRSHAPQDQNQDPDPTENGHGSKWGRSFRLANPAPPTERPWAELAANPRRYAVLWARAARAARAVSGHPAASRLWGNSHRFLQGAQNQDHPGSQGDPRVLVPNRTGTRVQLVCGAEEKPSGKKWAGCHLLGKTQPRPKRGVASAKTRGPQDQNPDTLSEEWAESWRFSVRPGGLKTPGKSLTGWGESWRLRLPPYPPATGNKAR